MTDATNPLIADGFRAATLAGVASPAAAVLKEATRILADANASTDAVECAVRWAEEMDPELHATVTRVKSYANLVGSLTQSDISELTAGLAEGLEGRTAFSEVTDAFAGEAQSNASRLEDLGTSLDTFAKESSSAAPKEFSQAIEPVRSAVTTARESWTTLAANFTALRKLATADGALSPETTESIRQSLTAANTAAGALKTAAEECEKAWGSNES
ncbi:hypothetical protein AB0940_33270 [Streptomyces sp. NPDC006656]|uniref:hypothetical protein n=1 Tax=Streptomyces sp. NPDC006656 TaxID=3156899 RepID=UPI0034519F28